MINQEFDGGSSSKDAETGGNNQDASVDSTVDSTMADASISDATTTDSAATDAGMIDASTTNDSGFNGGSGGGGTLARTYYIDTDGDGYGTEASTILASALLPGYSANKTDCDDTMPTVYPGAVPEVPEDSIDTNCDGHDGCSDVDCDGKPDLLVVEFRDSATNFTIDSGVYLSGKNYSNPGRLNIPTLGAKQGKVADLNQDGFQDIVIANSQDSATNFEVDSYVYWGSASGTFSATSRTALPTIGATDIQIDDIDSDGWEDILFVCLLEASNDFSCNSRIFWNSPAGFDPSGAAGRKDFLTWGGRNAAIADIDADGHKDIVFAESRNNSNVYQISSRIFWGNANRFAGSTSKSLPTIGANDVDIADLDNDGDLDILLTNYRTNTSNTDTDTYVYWQDSTQTSPNNRFGTGSGRRTSIPTQGAIHAEVAEIDGSPGLDIAFPGFRPDNNWGWAAPVRAYLGNTNSAMAYTSHYGMIGTLNGIAHVKAADIDSDGHMDIVASYREDHVTSGINPYYTESIVFWGSSTGNLNLGTRLPTIGPTHSSVGDLNGDGCPEIIFSNYRQGGSDFAVPTYLYWGDPTDCKGGPRTKQDLGNASTVGEVQFIGDASW